MRRLVILSAFAAFIFLSQTSCQTERQIPLDCEGGDCDFDCVTEDTCWSGCDYNVRLQCRPTVNGEGCVSYRQFREPCPSGYHCVPAAHPGADALCEPSADMDQVDEQSDVPAEMDIAEGETVAEHADDVDTPDQVDQDSAEDFELVDEAEAQELEAEGLEDDQVEEAVEMDTTDLEAEVDSDGIERETARSFSVQAEDGIRTDLSSPAGEIIYLEASDGEPEFLGLAVILGSSDEPNDSTIQIGDKLVFGFEVRTAGVYAIAVEYPAAPSCGQTKLYVDNQPITANIFDLDLYDTLYDIVTPFGHLGPTQVGDPRFLTAGEHTLELRVAGKSENATHYRIGADVFHFYAQ